MNSLSKFDRNLGLTLVVFVLIWWIYILYSPLYKDLHHTMDRLDSLELNSVFEDKDTLFININLKTNENSFNFSASDSTSRVVLLDNKSRNK